MPKHCVCTCVCVRVCACVHAVCVCTCVHACVRACVRACVHSAIDICKGAQYKLESVHSKLRVPGICLSQVKVMVQISL